jgi:hypothetical protein
MVLPLATLQDVFYIIGIVFMGIILILVIALLAAVFVIRSKVVSIQGHIQETIGETIGVAKVGARVAKAAANKVKDAATGSNNRGGRRRR